MVQLCKPAASVYKTPCRTGYPGLNDRDQSHQDVQVVHALMPELSSKRDDADLGPTVTQAEATHICDSLYAIQALLHRACKHKPENQADWKLAAMSLKLNLIPRLQRIHEPETIL